MTSDNIIRPQFKKPESAQLFEALHKELELAKYDHLSTSEIVGILEVIKFDLIERIPKTRSLA